MDCKYLLTIVEIGISLLLSQFIVNPDRLPKLLIIVRRESIDVCKVVINKRMSSAYNEG